MCQSTLKVLRLCGSSSSTSLLPHSARTALYGCKDVEKSCPRQGRNQRWLARALRVDRPQAAATAVLAPCMGCLEAPLKLHHSPLSAQRHCFQVSLHITRHPPSLLNLHPQTFNVQPSACVPVFLAPWPWMSPCVPPYMSSLLSVPSSLCASPAPLTMKNPAGITSPASLLPALSSPRPQPGRSAHPASPSVCTPPACFH